MWTLVLRLTIPMSQYKLLSNTLYLESNKLRPAMQVPFLVLNIVFLSESATTYGSLQGFIEYVSFVANCCLMRSSIYPAMCQLNCLFWIHSFTPHARFNFHAPSFWLPAAPSHFRLQNCSEYDFHCSYQRLPPSSNARNYLWWGNFLSLERQTTRQKSNTKQHVNGSFGHECESVSVWLLTSRWGSRSIAQGSVSGYLAFILSGPLSTLTPTRTHTRTTIHTHSHGHRLHNHPLSPYSYLSLPPSLSHTHTSPLLSLIHLTSGHGCFQSHTSSRHIQFTHRPCLLASGHGCFLIV